MNERPFLALLAALALSSAALGQSIGADRSDVSGFRKTQLVTYQKDKKAGIAMIVVGALLLTMFRAPEGRAGGGFSDFGTGDPMPVFLGAGLIVMGFNGLPAQPSWMPSISFVRRKPTVQWTVSRW